MRAAIGLVRDLINLYVSGEKNPVSPQSQHITRDDASRMDIKVGLVTREIDTVVIPAARCLARELKTVLVSVDKTPQPAILQPT